MKNVSHVLSNVDPSPTTVKDTYTTFICVVSFLKQFYSQYTFSCSFHRCDELQNAISKLNSILGPVKPSGEKKEEESKNLKPDSEKEEGGEEEGGGKEETSENENDPPKENR